MLQKQNRSMESLALVMAEDSSATSLNRKTGKWALREMGNILGTPRINREEPEETGTTAVAGGVGEEEPKYAVFWYGIIGWAKEILVKDYFKKELNNNNTGKVYLDLLLLVCMDTRVNFPLM